MADFLIEHLNEKGKEHSALNLLVSQWGFDEQLIPKALQGISSLFPHYSRHDESHSRQILVNIERVLGRDGISKLTATDTWLILEAAYWHDIGMVVPATDIREAVNDPEFVNMVNQLREDSSNELSDYCKGFSYEDPNNVFHFNGSPVESAEKFRNLMAEWFRRKHSDRAKPIVEDPWKTIGLSSPRTELIPKRLFNLLGRICKTHGEPFSKNNRREGAPI